MNAYVIVLGAIFAAISSAMIAYIAMATMIGPWIAPTIVLLSSMMLSMRKRKRAEAEQHKEVALIQSIASVGGVIGMGVGFSFPTLYFLNPDIFNAWMQAPIQFCALMAALCLAAGSFGMWLARMFSDSLLNRQQLSFPVSNLIYHSLSSALHTVESRKLLWGIGVTGLFCLVRDGIWRFSGLLQTTYYLLPSWLGRAVPLSLFPGPTLWAIGFSTGMTIAMPLLVGMLAQYALLWPLHSHAQWLGYSLFPAMAYDSFAMAFCSGLVLAEAVLGLTSYPGIIQRSIVTYWNNRTRTSDESGDEGAAPCATSAHTFAQSQTWLSATVARVSATGSVVLSTTTDYCLNHSELLVAMVTSVMVLYFLGFSLLSQVVLLSLCAIATYQICYLGGKVGLLPFGRFSTFVMVPMVLLFGMTCPMQITFLCVFVNIASGVAADLLFDYKVGDLCGLDRERIHRYQWFGLIVTALCIGFFLWVLCTNFQLGSAEMFAQRGKSRALLIQSFSLDPYVIMCGLAFGVVLSKLRMSPSLVMGGILMPNGISLGLIAGGFVSKLIKQPTHYASFWSGVFACESLWILLKVVGALCGLK